VVTRSDLPNATAVSTPVFESVSARPAIATAKPSDRRRADRDLESEAGAFGEIRRAGEQEIRRPRGHASGSSQCDRRLDPSIRIRPCAARDRDSEAERPPPRRP